MYLFQLTITNVRYTLTAIYIPLCIYFNFRQRAPCSCRVVFTFHYVSISTTCKYPARCDNLKFTFHYVSISTSIIINSTSLKIIYIPLCIYFNIRRSPAWFTAINDLHSTMYLFQPESVLYFPYLSMIFTFHYVSISTRFLHEFCFQWFHLHSTMYLFQREAVRRRYNKNIIYIPLCINFNLHAVITSIWR